MNAKMTQVIPGVYHLVFDSQRELASTFMRFQEFYESPKFKGVVFSRAEFIKWYSKEYGNGKFTYFTDWSGFNLPSSVLAPFFLGKFNPLIKEEKELLELFRNVKGPFYIIASCDKCPASRVVAHEIAHGLWYLNKKYRAKAERIVRSFKPKTRDALHAIFTDKGYGDNVLDDETHAYLITDAKMIRAFARLHDVDLDREWRKVVALQRLFTRTAKIDIPQVGEAK